MLTGELVPVDWHGLPVQVLNDPDWSSEVLILKCVLTFKNRQGVSRWCIACKSIYKDDSNNDILINIF